MPNPQPLRPIARRTLSAQSDQRLVQLAREDHGPAFEEIVRRYRSPLVAFAAAIVSANGAEDVVQASLAKAHGALLVDDRDINLRPWLFAIVRNCALNAIRGEPRVDELDEALSAHSSPSEIAEGRENFDRLVVAMCALPEAQRQALVKRELEGVGHGEIAAQLGTTATAVRGLIFRARTQLRNSMGALVPLPVLRALLAQGSAVGAAGGGASAALLGGAGAKGGAAIAAAVLALGTGIAIEGRKGENDIAKAAAETAKSGASDSNSGDGSTATVADSSVVSDEAGSAGAQSSSNSGGGPKSGSSASTGDAGSGSTGDAGSGGDSGSPGGSGGSSGSGGHGSTGPTPAPSAPGDDGSGHDGPAPGGGDDQVTAPPPAGSDDDHSGPSSGPSGFEHEGETTTATVEADHSGPGGGDQSTAIEGGGDD
jgi:RNA polymerase sigma factor (sigma-70 family)